jgi:hypothetical protein
MHNEDVKVVDLVENIHKKKKKKKGEGEDRRKE